MKPDKHCIFKGACHMCGRTVHQRYKEKFFWDDALCFKQNGEWTKYSTQQYIDNSYQFCYGLYEALIRKGDRIVTVSNSRPEWNFADMNLHFASAWGKTGGGFSGAICGGYLCAINVLRKRPLQK